MLRSYQYELDNVGNRLQTIEQYTQGQIRTIVRDYEYDDLYRLTHAVESHEGPPPEVIETSYSYDPAGNRLAMTSNRPEQGPVGDPVTTEYSYNEANWLLTATTDNKTTTYAYDDNGNRIQVAHPGGPPGPPQGIVESYQYDFENRLIEYERTGDGAVRRAFMEYDGLGRRFAKGTQQGGGNVFWTQYAYQQLGMDPLAEYPQTGPPRVTHLYRGRAGTLIGMEEQQGGGPGKEYWFSQDGLGNIATVTKHGGQAAHDYFYDPYGNIIDNNGRPEDSSNWTDPHNHYLLNGKEWDEEMRLHYFGARYYDSATGVWLTQDIYRGEPRRPMTLHRTLYVLANPVNYVDAYGYMAEIIPNGYGGVGGGSQATSTYNPTPPNATNPSNDPFHLDLPDPSNPHFEEYWEDTHITDERTSDPYSNFPLSCTSDGFCSVHINYGPGLQVDVGYPVVYLTGGYILDTSLPGFNRYSNVRTNFNLETQILYRGDPLVKCDNWNCEYVPPPPPNYPQNIAVSHIERKSCEFRLATCFAYDGLPGYDSLVYLKDFEDFDESNPIPWDEFEELLGAVAKDLFIHDIDSPGLKGGRAAYDTPFYNAGGSRRRTDEPDGVWPADQEVCIEIDDSVRCSGRSDVNYIAQGMWSAAAGESLTTAKAIVYGWKAIEYLHKPSEDTLFWLEYGYDYYQDWLNAQGKFSNLPITGGGGNTDIFAD